MNKLSLAEMKKIEFDILKNVAEFCEKNNIKYYLTYGTLLGAIRHQGFIPWDDDIDIAMPRPDYIKFNQLYPVKNKCNYYVLSSIITNSKHLYTFAKVFDIRTDKIEEGLNYDEDSMRGIDIDIFPLDGVPEDVQKCLAFKKTQKKLFRCFLYSRMPFQKSKSIVKTFLKYSILGILHAFGTSRFNKLINKRAMKYSFDTSEYIGSNINFFMKNKEHFKKSGFMKSIKVIFEGQEFNAPSDYDKYLTGLYGDYMQLPPKEEQTTHHIYKVWWK